LVSLIFPSIDESLRLSEFLCRSLGLFKSKILIFTIINSYRIKLIDKGNPLLDISAAVSEELLTKYDLKAGNACLAEPKHVPLYENILKSN
jgi:hypothetical protein